MTNHEYDVKVDKAEGRKCARCWKISQDVGQWSDLPDICLRCTDVVLLHDTGMGLHEHAMARFDKFYCEQLKGGASKEEAERIAVGKNLPVFREWTIKNIPKV